MTTASVSPAAAPADAVPEGRAPDTPPSGLLDRRRFLAGGSAALLASSFGIAGCTTGSDAVTTPTPTVAGGTATAVPSSGAAASAAGDTAAITDLRTRLHGSVLLPGDTDYEAVSAARNGRYLSLRPAVVARCADEDDVVTAVKWAKEHGLPPTVRGGGHSYAGYSSTNGFLIDVAALNTVDIDADTGTAVMGGAALNADIFTASDGGKWLLPGGTCGLVAMGGLTLGGGIGYHMHWAGLTSDHLTSTRMVTADGDILDVDENNDPDLFWASRGGGGGNFGVNTSFSYTLAEIPVAESVYFRFDWRGADAATAVLSAVDAILQTAPPALNMSTSASAAPVGPGGPREAIDVMSRGHFLGTVADLTDLLAPLIAIGGRTQAPTIVSQPFWTTAKTFISNEAPVHSWGDISRYAAEPVPGDAYAKMVDLLAECPSRTADSRGEIWSLGWVGGDVVDRFAPTDTAYVHRGMKTLLRPTPVWLNTDTSSVGNALMGWTLDVTGAIDPFVPGNSYQNFPNRFIDGWEQAYYGQNWERLRDVKTAYDPRNFFTNPQGIPPRFG